MTAIGFAMMAIGMIVHSLRNDRFAGPSDRLAIFVAVGLCLFLAGITKFLWNTLP